jgi:adenosylcobyric acid synthase
MIQGTGSSVGKSIIVTALCRIFLQDGFKACPFKAQNMSLNSFVTKEGGEMGRAQVVQAQAAQLQPHVDMNPVLIKPTSDTKAQIILQGKPVGNMQVKKYNNYKKRVIKNVLDSFYRLKKQYEIVVIEGAGSPAEINLKKHDIVNMKIAQIANSPVILVGDIDKGGVFASLVGTLELLSEREQKRIKGFIINKFRGDKNLLKGGLNFLEKKTGRPVLGVIPYFKDILIPEEDSVVLENKKRDSCIRNPRTETINVAVIKLPYTSNFTDFDALENEPDVRLTYVDDKEQLDRVDIIIIPGTKNTIKDLVWLRKTHLAQKIIQELKSDKTLPILIGICGGYQMLGKVIYDSGNIESIQKEIEGLGLLPIATTFKSEKILSQTEAIEIKTGIELKGYEIHHGRTTNLATCSPMLRIKGGRRLEGSQIEDGRIWGTYLHGIFDNTRFRRNFLNKVRNKIGLRSLPAKEDRFNLENEFDKLAALIRKNIDMKLLYKILDCPL